MRKIKVNICVGTTCFVMGASELQELEQHLPDELRDRVEITGSTCLGLCKDNNYGQAPFVTIDGEVMPHASISAIIERLHTLTRT